MTIGPQLSMLLENKSYVEAINTYRKNTNTNWLEATTWLQTVAGQLAIEKVNQNLTDKRFEKLCERMEQLLNVYGMTNLLKSLILRANQLEEKENSHLTYLRLLIIDLEHTLKNYENRYDAAAIDFNVDDD